MRLNAAILVTIFLTTGCAIFSAAQPAWNVNPFAFEFSMTITARVTLDGNFSDDVNDQVAAFIRGNCRGFSKLTYDGTEGGCFVYLMVYSNSPLDTITFKIYDASKNEVINAKNRLIFTINKILGTAYLPIVIASEKLSSDAKLLSFTIPDQVGETTFSDRHLYLQKSPNSNLTGITASFSVSEGAKVYVRGTKQESGKNLNNFENPLDYSVIPADYSDTAVYTVHVLSRSDKSPVFTSIPPVYVMQDEVYIYLVATSDAEGDKVTLQADGLPSWLIFNPATGLITGIPHNGQVGIHSFKIRASDGIMESVQNVTVQVINKNDPPEIKSIFGNQVFYVNRDNAILLPSDCITDPDVGDVLTFTLLLENNAALPDWLSFNPGTMKISGNPPESARGVYKLKLSATDQGKLKEWIVFELHVDVASAAGTLAENSDFIIYPNPFSNELYINTPGDAGDFLISVYSYEGKYILPAQEKAGSLCKLHTKTLLPGMYFIILSNGQYKVIRKIVKQ
jgi:hypothetical protein